MRPKILKVAKSLHQKGYIRQARTLLRSEYDLSSVYNLPQFNLYPPEKNLNTMFSELPEDVGSFRKDYAREYAEHANFVASEPLEPRSPPGSDSQGLYEQKEYFKGVRDFRDYHEKKRDG